MGLISKHLCKCTIHMYAHTHNALDDPIRSSSAAGLVIWPVSHFCGKIQTFDKHSLKLKCHN